MKWSLSIFTKSGKKLLFAAQCADWIEAKILATQAREMRPGARIYLRSPAGEVTVWA